MSFSNFSIKIHQNLFSKSIAIDQVNYSICSTYQHFLAATNVPYFTDIFYFKSKIIFEITMAKVEEFDKLSKNNRKM